MEMCKSCLYYKENNERKTDREKDGFCHFNPPVVIPPGDNRYRNLPYDTVFPFVAEDDWCGKYYATIK